MSGDVIFITIFTCYFCQLSCSLAVDFWLDYRAYGEDKVKIDIFSNQWDITPEKLVDQFLNSYTSILICKFRVRYDQKSVIHHNSKTAKKTSKQLRNNKGIGNPCSS